jgi:hypothetical protein
MAISYHLAELVQRIYGDVSSRRPILLKAQGFYERFLKLLDSYDMLGKSDAKLFEAYLEDRTNFSTASTRDAAARREAKVARFREEKELKKKLEVSCTELHSCGVLRCGSSICSRTRGSPRTTSKSFVSCISQILRSWYIKHSSHSSP